VIQRPSSPMCCVSSGMPLGELPDAFCWTKMQAEAGQRLDLIVRRKELERLAGNGRFFWGIGNSVRKRVGDLVNRVSAPRAIFSTMKSAPKSSDVRPDSTLLWTAHFDRDGSPRPLPEYVLLLRRGTTAKALRLATTRLFASQTIS